MKEAIKRIFFIKHVLGLLYILLYSLYIGLNLYFDRGNHVINTILLILNAVYLVVYIYTSFIVENKKAERVSKKNFKRVRKFIGFVNSCMIIASVATNSSNSFFSVFLAVISVIIYFIYVIFDILFTIATRKIKEYTNIWRTRHDNTN